MYRTALTLAGFDVQEAVDGLDALRRLEHQQVDLIVLDVLLPDISGISLRQEAAAHAHTRDIPIVIVTGSSMDLSSLDVACVLRKPVSPEQLIATVRRCLKAGRLDLEGA